jgi:hypothetical protein
MIPSSFVVKIREVRILAVHTGFRKGSNQGAQEE